MSDVPQEIVSLAAEVEVLRLVVVDLVRRLPREDRTAIEAARRNELASWYA